MGSTARFRKYANILVSIHFLWTLFLIGGAVAMFFYPLYAWMQIYVMSFTLLISLPFGTICPLTLLEEKLRRKIDPAYDNHGSYIATYFNKISGKNVSVRRINEISAGLYVIAYAAAISILILYGYGFLH